MFATPHGRQSRARNMRDSRVRYVTASRGTSRAAKVTAARKTNIPVTKALTRPNRRVRFRTNKYRNKTAIVTLARQVRALQMKHYGDIQYTRQALCRTSGTKDIKGPGVFMHDSPYLFELKNFFNGALVWRGSMSSNNVPGAIQDAKWLALPKSHASGALKPYAFDVTNDAVSTEQYMPLTAFYKWHMKWLDVAAGSDKIVQLTVFKLKSVHNNPKIKTALPDYLGQYANMCVEDPSDRNKFSPVYHQVLHQRTYNFRNTGDVTKHVERWINLKWSFSRKDGLIRLDTEQINDQVDLDLNDPTNSHQTETGANFAHYIRPEEQIYVLLSTSNAQNSHAVEISCMRTLRWRDTQGVTSI